MSDVYAFSIGDLATASGTTVQTIRYYEQSGLMPVAARTEGRQRRYAQTHLDRLKFIRHARELGFPVDDIRELLRLSAQKDAPCDAADRIAAEQLAEVKRKIARLQALEVELERMVGECRHGTLADCRIIETLADHSLCSTAH
jgi:DNA-binding transcriptional MerR regulator